MRTSVLTAPGRIDVVERPDAPLGPTEVRVRPRACGVCASELPLWLGQVPDELPAAIGHEIAGVVDTVGRRVETLGHGDHVVVWVSDGGGFADGLVADERDCIAFPPGLAHPEIAEPLSCIVGAVERANPALGADVVIVGAGFMGLLLLLVSGTRGPRSITMADIRPDALALAARLGATRVVDTRSESLRDAVLEETHGRGADVSYECTGVEAGLRLVGDVTRMSGTLAIVGYHQGAARSVPLGHWNWMGFTLVNAHFRDRAQILAAMRAGLRLVESGRVDPTPLVTHRFALDELAAAFEAAASKPEGFVKATVILEDRSHGADPTRT